MDPLPPLEVDEVAVPLVPDNGAGCLSLVKPLAGAYVTVVDDMNVHWLCSTDAGEGVVVVACCNARLEDAFLVADMAIGRAQGNHCL